MPKIASGYIGRMMYQQISVTIRDTKLSCTEHFGPPLYTLSISKGLSDCYHDSGKQSLSNKVFSCANALIKSTTVPKLNP